MSAPVTIRIATASDAKTIYDFIVALAIYEREPDAVETTPEALGAQLARRIRKQDRGCYAASRW